MCGEITNQKKLRCAYELLNICREIGYSEEGEKIKEIKREIRKYHKIHKKEKLIRNDGIDGYVTLIELPDYLENKEEAEDYFGEHHAICAKTSAFDCTGQAFTSGVHIFRRRNHWMAYHSVAFDV